MAPFIAHAWDHHSTASENFSLTALIAFLNCEKKTIFSFNFSYRARMLQLLHYRRPRNSHTSERWRTRGVQLKQNRMEHMAMSWWKTLLLIHALWRYQPKKLKHGKHKSSNFYFLYLSRVISERKGSGHSWINVHHSSNLFRQKHLQWPYTRTKCDFMFIMPRWFVQRGRYYA